MSDERNRNPGPDGRPGHGEVGETPGTSSSSRSGDGGAHGAEPERSERQYLFDKPRNVKILLWTYFAVAVALVLADLFVHRHVEHPWEHLFGFYGLYGYVGSVFLVLSAKELRRVLMKPEGFYDDAD
jgi:hypothetical protein